MFDFSVLEEVGVLCVRCTNPEESHVFWDEVFQNYQRTSWSESTARSIIEEAHARFGQEVCYELDWNPSGRLGCGWDEKTYFIDKGYRVFDFSELMHINCDLGEIKSEGNVVDVLFSA